MLDTAGSIDVLLHSKSRRFLICIKQHGWVAGLCRSLRRQPNALTRDSSAIAIMILGERLGGVPARHSLLALPLTVRNLSVSGASLERKIMLVTSR